MPKVRLLHRVETTAKVSLNQLACNGGAQSGERVGVNGKERCVCVRERI